MRGGAAIVRVLFASHACCLDTTNGASIANRALALALARNGCAVEVLSGSHGLPRREDHQTGRPGVLSPGDWAGRISSPGAGDARVRSPKHCRLIDRGVPTTLHLPGLGSRPRPGESETSEFLQLFDEIVGRFRPDVLVSYGGDPIALASLSRARNLGISTVFTLHNFHYSGIDPFHDVDVVLVPSRFAAEYYRKSLGLECISMPLIIGDLGDVRCPRRTATYLTFVNPSIEKGVYPFARIADELGRWRPDIPILVVESRGTEATVAACGLELRDHGTVYFMSHTADRRDFWGVTKVCLMPSLWRESQGLVAVEAMVNGIPVIATDRGALPETLGEGGVILGLPSRLTWSTRELPTAEEVRPWIEAIIGLWDDATWYDELSRRASAESRRWAPEILEPRYVALFRNLNRPATWRSSGSAGP